MSKRRKCPHPDCPKCRPKPKVDNGAWNEHAKAEEDSRIAATLVHHPRLFKKAFRRACRSTAAYHNKLAAIRSAKSKVSP